MTDSTDPRAIEAELERDRAALASTLDTLSDRVSVDGLAKEALGMLKRNAGSATTTIDGAVRGNPIAVALIGAGVAWMLLGPRLRGGASWGSYDYDAAPRHVPGHDDGASALGYDGSLGTDGGSSGYASGYGRTAVSTGMDDDDHGWSREAGSLRERAMAALRRIESEARSYASSLRGGLSMSGGERDFESERQGVISSFASDLRARFAHGLEALSPDARDRVVAARERAYGAMLQAERLGRDAVRDPARALEEHPLVAGAVAFAVGAAVAAALPRTDAEDRAFGSERDRLMGEAAQLLRQERERAMGLAGSLTQEIRSAAQDTLGAVTDSARGAIGTVTESARGALGQVAEAATQGAQEAAHRVAERAGDEVRQAVGDAGGDQGDGQGGATVVVDDADPGDGRTRQPGLAGPGDPVIG